MIPGVWEFALLALAAFRATRLLGWDTFPPIVRLRERIVGTTIDPDGGVTFRDNWMLDLLACPFCLGWWVALGFYGSWLLLPSATLVLAVPLALGALVGLTAKNLDP